MTDPGNDTSGHNGAPKGSIIDTPFASPIPIADLARAVNQGVGAVNQDAIPSNDPAFQPPGDPLVGDTDRRKVYRDVPLITIQNSWTVAATRAALVSHMEGVFDGSAQLVDSMLGDDRVQATLGSRVSGLFGREVRHRAANDSSAARECLDAWEAHWEDFVSSYALTESHSYGIFMGFAPGQILWDTSGDVWKPYARPWHPRYVFYHWPMRKYVAISLDGLITIEPGDGKWYLHAPYGQYRGWIRGAVRSVAEPWLIRHFAIRDWARYSEIHGLPTRVGKVPASSAPDERAKFESSIANLGSDTSMIIPTGVDPQNSYDYALVEAAAGNWEAFPGLIDRCDMSIVLALMFQNLTTEVNGGSFAATTAHMDIREQGLQFDNTAWCRTLHRDFQRPFAFLNFGDPDLAPYTDWDVAPVERYESNGKKFAAFGQAMNMLRAGGVKFKDPAEVRKFVREQFGLFELPDFEMVDTGIARVTDATNKPSEGSGGSK